MRKILAVVLLIALAFFNEVFAFAEQGFDVYDPYDESVFTNDISNTWWSDPNVYCGAIVPSEMDDLVDVVAWGSPAYDNQGQDSVWHQAQSMQARGGHYVGAISTWGVPRSVFVDNPELEEAAIIDLDGNTIITGELWPDEVLWQNTNHPIWKDFLYEQGVRLIDAGVDGIQFDTPQGTVDSVWRGGSFGEVDMDGFRSYLVEKYSTDELKERFGIENIQSFNYGNYIRATGLRDDWFSDPQSVPLFFDFFDFQQVSIKEFHSSLQERLNQYSLQQTGREIVFSANISLQYAPYMVVTDQFDYFMSEHDYPWFNVYPYGPRYENYGNPVIPNIRIANSLGKPTVIFPNLFSICDLAVSDSSGVFVSRQIAEAFASGGHYLVPEKWGCWTEEGVEHVYSSDFSVIRPYYEFFIEHPNFFETENLITEVAVIYSFASDYYDWEEYRNDFRGLNYALLDAHAQHAVEVLADGRFIENRDNQIDLNRYKVLFAPSATHLSDAQVDLILSFVYQGGTLVTWGGFGDFSEQNVAKERPDLLPFSMPGSYDYGQGHIEVLDGKQGLMYLETEDPDLRQNLLSIVKSQSAEVTSYSGPEGLKFIVQTGDSGHLVAIHAINYGYDLGQSDVPISGLFHMGIKTPAEFSGGVTSDFQLYSFSPQRAEIKCLPVSRESSNFEFEHPGISIYEVLVLIRRNEAVEIFQETMESMQALVDLSIKYSSLPDSLGDLQASIQDELANENYFEARRIALLAKEALMNEMRPKILFDETHGELNTLSWERALEISPENPEWIYFGKMAELIEDEFVFERNADAPLSLELLQNYNVLMIAAPDETFDTIELAAVEQFVADGGGLLVLGDCGLNDSVNSLTSAYGITYDPHSIISSIPDNGINFFVDRFADHPAITGAQQFWLNCAESLKVEGFAKTLALTDDGVWQDNNWNGKYDQDDLTGSFVVAAAYEGELGRVIAIADNAFHDVAVGLDYQSNELFLQPLLNWLTDPNLQNEENDSTQISKQGFDYLAYLAANPDLPPTWGKAECMEHYKLFGFWENRAVSFNLDEYLNANPDLPTNWTYDQALAHYNAFGINENRLLAFSADEYLSLYPDLPQDWTYDQAYSHYVYFGKLEGRIASFDETTYLELYPDLPQTWGQTEAFYHYVQLGQYEGRVYDPYDEGVFLTD